MPFVHVRHQIAAGPAALYVTLHIERVRVGQQLDSLRFIAPTFQEAVSRRITKKVDDLHIKFVSTRTLQRNRIFFNGLVHLAHDSNGIPAGGLPVYGCYDTYAESGWVRVDSTQKLQIYLM